MKSEGIKMGVRPRSGYSEFLLTDNRNIGPGVQVPWDFQGPTDGSFTLDTVNRTFTANQSGVYLVLWQLLFATTGVGAVYSVRVNGVENPSIFGVLNPTTGNQLNGQLLLELNDGDRVSLGNTGNTADTTLSAVDGQNAINAGSIIFVRVADN
jgi:hypothetical protein